MIKIVGFIGNIRAGKTTAAKYLVEQGYVRLRFAQALKDMLEFGLCIPHEYIDGDKKNEPCEQLCGRTARHAMMTLGTEWGRDMIHPDIWVKALERELFLEIGQGEYNFVIDDLRFLSEVKWFRALHDTKKVVAEPVVMNGRQIGMNPEVVTIESRIIRIERPNGEIIDHQSETEQIGVTVDSTIDNNHSLDSLYKNIDFVVKQVFKKE